MSTAGPAAKPLEIAFFGSSLVSAYWNGAATYYRGIIRALHKRGHRVRFFEPDAYERQHHRDMPDPDWAEVIVYAADGTGEVERALAAARSADVIIKASGVGVFDRLLEQAVPAVARPGAVCVYWDVDAPATLERMAANPDDPFRAQVSRYDLVLTYGGGEPVINAYEAFGARRCVPIYNALDPDTHHPVAPDPRFEACLAFLGNRLPDRETRVDRFFFEVAREMPAQRFVLGGSGWEDKAMPDNVHYCGHVYTRDHNAFNCTPTAVLNISRDSMARFGFSPATRVFEAAGAGACLITDRWDGIEEFLMPGTEVLVADDGAQVIEHLTGLMRAQAQVIGNAARARVLHAHTYAHRAAQVEAVLTGMAATDAAAAGA